MTENQMKQLDTAGGATAQQLYLDGMLDTIKALSLWPRTRPRTARNHEALDVARTITKPIPPISPPSSISEPEGEGDHIESVATALYPSPTTTGNTRGLMRRTYLTLSRGWARR